MAFGGQTVIVTTGPVLLLLRTKGLRPNPPMKLSARGGRSVGKKLILSAAAAGRTLWAPR